MNTSSYSIQSAPGATTRSRGTFNLSTKGNYPDSMTEKVLKTTEDIIAQRFEELNDYINNLDPKIKRIVEHNEAEILIAYRNHFGKIQEEVQRFKEETLAQVKN